MVTKVFAKDYEKDVHGYYHFPSDVKLRGQLFPHLLGEMQKHPAKANIFMTQEVIRYVSEPGETILDPFGGTGTTLLGAMLGRNVIVIEIEEMYQGKLQQAMDNFKPNAVGTMMLIPGDSKQVLPLPGICDHIVTSPPYAGIMRKDATDIFTLERMDDITNYSKHPDNIGKLNDFYYNQTMEQIYRKCFITLKPGGSMTVIIKDHIDKQRRVNLSDRALKMCIQAGFTMQEWLKWLPPGSAYGQIMKAKGMVVVEDEDILILRRPL